MLRHKYLFFITISILLVTRLHAAPPEAPVIDCQPPECVIEVSGSYDLSGFDVHFNVAWPIPPSTNSTINVPSDMSFASAVANSNVRVVVAPGYSGGGSSNWGNDVDVVMSNTATITSTVDFRDSQRIRWTGGNVSASLNADGFTDILINNLHVQSSGIASNWSVTARPFQRLALINSTFTGGSSGSTWGIYTRPTPGSQNHRDMIIANVVTRSTGYQAARLQAVDRLVVVDSVGLNPTGTDQSGWRMHYGCNQVYAKNIIGRGLFIIGPNASEAPGSPQVIDAVFDNWHQYQTQAASQMFALHGTGSNTGVVRNSTLHWTNGAGSLIGISPMIDDGTNDRVSWDGSTIDYTVVPGKNSLSDFGANH